MSYLLPRTEKGKETTREMATEQDLRRIVKEEVAALRKEIKEELVRQRKLLAVGEERAYDPKRVNIDAATKP